MISVLLGRTQEITANCTTICPCLIENSTEVSIHYYGGKNNL